MCCCDHEVLEELRACKHEHLYQVYVSHEEFDEQSYENDPFVWLIQLFEFGAKIRYEWKQNAIEKSDCEYEFVKVPKFLVKTEAVDWDVKSTVIRNCEFSKTIVYICRHLIYIYPPIYTYLQEIEVSNIKCLIL